jgi:predicted nucleic acid-binding protein
VDSNVIQDVATEDKAWSTWSSATLARVAGDAVLVINPIIYAEVSSGYASIEELEAAAPSAFFRRDPLPWEAAFLAGKAFVTYRKRGGQRRSPLPDFYIGAHAAIAGFRLLPRDARRYSEYFPTVELIAP